MTAAERILSKALAASKIDSSQWASIQAGLRDRAFFSAKVTEVRVLHETRELAAKVAAGELSASEFRDRVRKALSATGYEAKEDEGTIKDLTTRRRLDLIMQTNVRQARGYVQHLEATSQGALLAEPAYELIRVRERAQPRDWITRWKKAGGKIYPGARMIALKTDPIWVAISRFGNPFPPFDYGSGMGIRGIRRSEALRLGVITPETPPQKPPEIHLNGSLQAEVQVSEGSKEAKMLDAAFGDQVRLVDGKAMWRAEVLEETVLNGKDFSVKLGEMQPSLATLLGKHESTAPFAKRLEGQQLTIDQTWRDTKRREGGTHLAHFMPSNKHPEDSPLTPGDLDMLPGIWRNPDRVYKLGRDKILLEADAFDGNTYMLQISFEDGVAKVWTFFKTSEPTSKKLAAASERHLAVAQGHPRISTNATTPHIIPKT